MKILMVVAVWLCVFMLGLEMFEVVWVSASKGGKKAW